MRYTTSLLVTVFVGSLLIFHAGCGRSPTKIAVREEDFGDRRPPTVPSGQIYKRASTYGRSEVIFVAPEGEKYGLNGTALSAGYRDIHQITKYENVSYGRRYEDVSELIGIGLSGTK